MVMMPDPQQTPDYCVPSKKGYISQFLKFFFCVFFFIGIILRFGKHKCKNSFSAESVGVHDRSGDTLALSVEFQTGWLFFLSARNQPWDISNIRFVSQIFRTQHQNYYIKHREREREREKGD